LLSGFPLNNLLESTMPLPASSHPCWARAASGGLSKINTSNLAMQLLSKRMERSADPVPQKAGEVHAFFVKWERMLSSEITQLQSL
jgi:hypothetical protein